jgi:hypothetical protein
MKAEVKLHNGTPTLFLDGQPNFGGHQWLSQNPAPGNFPGRECVRLFGQAGVHLYALAVGAAPDWCGHWRGPQPGDPSPYDFSMVEGQLRAILDADPQARFHLRLYFETQEWWNRLHPDECEVASDGRRYNQSYASAVWRADVNAFLRAYHAHLQTIGLADRVIAWQVQAGVCGEWIKGDIPMSPLCGDFCAPMRRHFRGWLRKRYGSDAALRAAWADPAAGLDTAEVPSAEEQHRATLGSFRDPAREQKTADYYQCLAELAADDLIEFCRTVKDMTNGQALAGAFYGYLMELAWNNSFFVDGYPPGGAEFSTIQRSGHLGLRRVLASPHVDYLVSPYGYAFRGIGGDGLPMPPTESLRRHGKLYILEEDSRLHNEMDPGGRNFDRRHTLAIYQREFAQALTHGLALWWFADWPVGSYTRQEPDFQPWLDRFARLGDWALRLDRTPRAEVAVFLDDQSFFHESLRNHVDLPAIFQQRVISLNRFGAPHDVYLLDDLLDGGLPDYKLCIFLNAFALDRGRREALKRAVRRAGRSALWLYAPGFLEPGREAGSAAHVDHMADLTGFRFGQGNSPWGPFMHLTDFTHPITRGLPQDLFWGTTAPIAPLFHVEDPEARVLGQVVYSLGRCQPGLAVKELPAPAAVETVTQTAAEGAAEGARWTSVYCATPNIPPQVLRGIARHAGAHLYSDDGDVLYATPDLLSVHTVSGGPREFRLPRRAGVVYDLFADRVVARDADRFRVDLPPISTHLWFTGDEQLLP